MRKSIHCPEIPHSGHRADVATRETRINHWSKLSFEWVLLALAAQGETDTVCASPDEYGREKGHPSQRWGRASVTYLLSII
jgi:hypothetical protein